MKEFYGSVSIAARLSFAIKANSESEAVEKLFNACCPISLIDEDGNEIEITEQEWNMIDEPARGNVRECYIDDLEIYEEN